MSKMWDVILPALFVTAMLVGSIIFVFSLGLTSWELALVFLWAGLLTAAFSLMIWSLVGES